MKKQQQQDISYKSISKNESYLLDVMKHADLAAFGVKELRVFTKWDDNRIYNTLSSLEKKGLLVRVKRNFYTIQDIIDERLYEIVTEIIKPSYISFWTALSYYGFTEQQVKPMQLIATKQYKSLRIAAYNIEITTFKPIIFFGYKKINGFVIGEPEKVLIDSLYQPDKCGGLNEFVKCLKNSWKMIDKKKLIEYVVRFGNSSLISRMGYLIEATRLENRGLLEKLIKHRSLGYIKLSFGNQKILNYNRRWNVIINHDIKFEEIK